MDILEELPDTIDAVVFAAAMLLIFINAVIITGHFPRQSRAFSIDLALCIMVVATTALFASNVFLAIEVMPWFVIVIFAGLAFLFAPLIEQQLPISLRRLASGLFSISACTGALTAVTLQILGYI